MLNQALHFLLIHFKLTNNNNNCRFCNRDITEFVIRKNYRFCIYTIITISADSVMGKKKRYYK